MTPLGSVLGTIRTAKKNEVCEEVIPESTRFHFASPRTIIKVWRYKIGLKYFPKMESLLRRKLTV